MILVLCIFSSIQLFKRKHAAYLHHGICNLSNHFECLDASRPWLVYWITHSMRLLGLPLSNKIVSDITEFLSRCQAPSGGFGGQKQGVVVKMKVKMT